VIAHERRAMALMAAFALAWVLLEDVVGAHVQGHYPLMQVVWCRYAVHLVAMLLLFGWRDPGRLWRTRRPVFQLSRSLLMLAMPLSFALSLRVGLPSDTVWGEFWFAPLCTLLIARLMMGERVPWPVWAATAAGWLGSAVILRPAAELTPGTALLPLAMALSFGVYLAMTRSLRSEVVHANLFYTAVGVFALLSPVMPMIWVTPNVHDALVLVCIGLVGLFALFLLDRAAAMAPLAASTPFVYVQVLGVLTLAWVWHGHAPGRASLLAALSIAAVLGWLWWRGARERAPSAVTFTATREPAP
jgi:drug/metabolite transporter (DMT)-like permease